MKSKCLEYYLDSKIYNDMEVQESINETKKEFKNKEISVEVSLNCYGVYIITFYFENKDTLFNKIKIIFKKKQKTTYLLKENNEIKNEETKSIEDIKYIPNTRRNNINASKREKNNKEKSRLEKYYGNKYGQYKTTKVYRPY